MSATVGTRGELLEDLIERYPQVPPEAVLKEDLASVDLARSIHNSIVLVDPATTYTQQTEIKTVIFILELT